MNLMNIDFGEKEHELPLAERNSISIVLGAGFSASMGYPIGNDMNERLLHFDDRKIYFTPSGKLVVSRDWIKSQIPKDGMYNIHQKYFIFCKRLIKEYAKTYKFDYEEFYDFIKTDEVKQECYQRLCDNLLDEYENYENYLFNVSHIYNQMVEYLLKDRNGKSRYDDEPFKINNVDGYNGFLQYLSQLSKEFIIHVHTLNHDLLFESFNRTGLINGKISDGFDEYGSEYYGKLEHDKRNYHCRLERYTGRYNTPIRLYKLHGSLDYVLFYRTSVNSIMIPEKYVKTKWGIDPADIMKSRKSKIGYDESPFEYHADFLTGTTSKILRYKEPLLFKKLFKKFKNNLRNSKKLIIIGYGCKDERINELIKENFDYKHKPSFIVDAYAKEGSQVDLFKKEINAKHHKVEIEKINKSLFV